MLQINDLFSENLFDLQPSLRSDTRANIAAGAVVIAQWWNQGISGPLPVVNDSDPEWLINWYYALSSYNGGPDLETRVWTNNPNCNQVILNCGPFQLGDTYRLRAELGSLDDPTSYYVGQYTQDLRFAGGPQALPLTRRVSLPIVLNQRVPDNLLRNGTFSIGQPDQPLWPEYWQIQSTLSREDNTNPGAVISSTYRLEPSSGLVLKATRRGATDVRQRVHLAVGTYELRVQVNVLNRDPQTNLQIRARPARPGPGVWSVIERIPADGAGRRTYTYRLRLAGPTTFGFLASFGPRDSTSQFQLTAVRLVRLGP